MKRVLCLFGTRSEIVELAPVLHALRTRARALETLHVAASQDTGPLHPFARAHGVEIHEDLRVGEEGRTPSAVVQQVLAALDPILARTAPDLLLVQGDTATSMAGALAAFLRGVPVGHVAVGLHEGYVARLATIHFDGDGGEQIASAVEAFLADPAPDAGARPARALSDFVEAAKREIAEISPEEVRALIDAEDRGGWHFVDVREPDEYAAGHLPGAKASPRGFLEVKADLAHAKRDPWFEDRARKLILYCGGGHRSALAARTLQEMGFTRVRSLAEGWTGWTRRGYPVER